MKVKLKKNKNFNIYVFFPPGNISGLNLLISLIAKIAFSITQPLFYHCTKLLIALD